MLWKGEAGIDCMNCGHKTYVASDKGLAQLESRLCKRTGSPQCPDCGHPVTIEDYLGDDPRVRAVLRPLRSSPANAALSGCPQGDSQ